MVLLLKSKVLTIYYLMIRDNINNMQHELNTNTLIGRRDYVCENCSMLLQRNGYVKRKVKHFVEYSIFTETFCIQCYRCPSCKTQHRLVPNEWIPYHRYTAEAIESILEAKCNIGESTIIRQQARFKSCEFVNRNA